MTNQKCTVSIQEFYESLERHDWYFGWTEDRHAYRAGEESYAALEATARAGGEQFRELLNEYSKHCFTGKPWGTVQHPKPPAPGSVPAGVKNGRGAAQERAQPRLKTSGVNRYAGARKRTTDSLQWFYIQPKRQGLLKRLADHTGLTDFLCNLPYVKPALIIYKRLVVAFTTPIH